jgi:acyl carrier protein
MAWVGGADAIHAGDRIPEDLGDIFVRESLDAVEFVLHLEEELNVRIPDGPIGDLLSKETLTVKEVVAGLYGMVAGQLAEAGRAQESPPD